MNRYDNVNVFFFAEKIIILLPIALLFSNLISEFLIIILSIIFITKLDKKQISKIISNKIFICLFVLIIYFLINYILNLNKDPDIKRSLFFFRFPLYVISLSFFLSSEFINKKKIFLYWGVILLIICIDLQFQNIFGKNIFGYNAVLQGDVVRLGSFLNDETKIAYFINNLFSVFLGSLIFYKNKSKNLLIYLILSTLFVVYTVYLTGERSNFISLLIFIFIFFLINNFKNFIFFTFISVMTILVLNVSDLKESSKFKRMITQNIQIIKSTLISDNERGFLYKDNQYFSHYSTAIEMYKEYPVLGVGLKNFRNYCNKQSYKKNIYPSWKNNSCSTHPHNPYFEILSELGTLGFLVFFGSFFIIFYMFIKEYIKNKNPLLFANTIILMTYFVPFLPKGSFFTNWNAIIFWTIFAINCHLLKSKSYNL